MVCSTDALCITRAHTLQALQTGRQLRATLDAAHGGDNYRMFFMTSPYTRTLETTDLLLDAFTDQQVCEGVLHIEVV